MNSRPLRSNYPTCLLVPSQRPNLPNINEPAAFLLQEKGNLHQDVSMAHSVRRSPSHIETGHTPLIHLCKFTLYFGQINTSGLEEAQ